MSEDQPDGIEEGSNDLPDPLKAAERVNAFLSAYGDGRIVAEWLPEYLPPGGQPPLYARDLAALADTAKYRRYYDDAMDVRMDVEKILDVALGTEEEDGAGAGIAADVALLAEQRDQARDIAVHLEQELAEAEQRVKWLVERAAAREGR